VRTHEDDVRQERPNRCKITTTAGWTAETMDLQVTVWVLLKIEGI